MRIPFPGIILAALLAVPSLRAQQPSSDVGMGLFPFLVGDLDGSITRIVDDCVQSGIDTVYVSVFRTTGARIGDLWITDSAGSWNPSHGQVRPSGAGIDLAALIGAAHARDLRVVGVLKCFHDTVQPNDAAHRRYLLDVVDYFVDAYTSNGEPVYDLDGLALDYVRFVGSGTGNDPSFVTDFVRDVKARIGALSLHAYVIANRYTFDGPSYDGVFRSYGSVIASLASQFGQHWEQMARHVDVMMPMCYTADGSIYSSYALHQAYVRQAALYCRVACNRSGVTPRRVQPTIKTYRSTGETTTPLTVGASITGALLGGADGYQAFRYGTMEAAWWPVVAQWAVPGPNFPVPLLVSAPVGVTVTLDPTSSRDGDQPAGGLTVRFDLGNDGTFDIGWRPLGPVDEMFASAQPRAVGFQVRDQDGHVASSRRHVGRGTVMQSSVGFLWAGSGGGVDLSITAGPAVAGATFLVLGSRSGSSPGTPWVPGLDLPLNLDALTEALLLAVNTSVLQGGLGALDASGSAVARFQVPAGVLRPLALQQLSFSLIAVGPAGGAWFVGDHVGVFVFP